MQHNTFKTEKNPLDIEGAITGIGLIIATAALLFGLLCIVAYW